MSSRLARQRGITFLGLLIGIVVFAGTAVVGMKAFPVFTEYRAVRNLVNQSAQSGGSSVQEIRADFDRRRAIEYGVEVRGSDLEVSKENDKIVVRYEYEREVEVGGPVYLLFKLKGESR